MITVNFVKNGLTTTVKGEEGISLLDLAMQNDIDLVGNCGGACSCGTCHVLIPNEWLSKVDKATEDEEDVLDIVFNLTPNSRLGCQIFLNKNIDGITVEIV